MNNRLTRTQLSFYTTFNKLVSLKITPSTSNIIVSE